jgi:UDP-2,4-diacetamido-2,4,6-trideoxy-beta-L-altropyranose hydrolase
LADQLRRRGAEVQFVCRQLPGDAREWLTGRGFAVQVLAAANCPGPPDGEQDPEHAAWLGVTGEQDCRETHDMLAESGPWDWLIVDHYSLDRRWESAMRDCVRRIAVIDDLADREHDCELLLDQNLVAGMAERYSGKLPEHCASLLGPRFALLQDTYADLRSKVRPRKGAVKRLLVFFGGADPDNLTARALVAIEALGRADVAVDVVIGNSNPHRAKLTAMAAGIPSVVLHADLPSLASLMVRADLAIGASGTTAWERCCLGLPSLVITFAANQEAIAAELDRRGLVRWLGDAATVGPVAIRRAVDETLQCVRFEQWSRDCMAQVDGLGARRVAGALLADSAMNLTLRLSVPTDEELLLNWANEPLVRGNSFSPCRIDPADHHQWFTRRLNDRDACYIYVAESELAVPVGQVRFERLGNDWQIDYSLDCVYRGLGLGRKLLEKAIASLRSERRDGNLLARVKITNGASLHVFQRLGFESHLDSEVATFTLKEGGW